MDSAELLSGERSVQRRDRDALDLLLPRRPHFPISLSADGGWTMKEFVGPNDARPAEVPKAIRTVPNSSRVSDPGSGGTETRWISYSRAAHTSPHRYRLLG
jgi:hypothetical protein